MPPLRITPRATLDLIEIWSYIADDSVENADIFVDQLNEAMQKLCHHPGMGRQREELAPRLRSFPYQRYVIFYRADSNALEIVRVLHGARDVESGFEGDVTDIGSDS
jgi:toxin ParE1/3/4